MTLIRGQCLPARFLVVPRPGRFAGPGMHRQAPTAPGITVHVQDNSSNSLKYIRFREEHHDCVAGSISKRRDFTLRSGLSIFGFADAGARMRRPTIS
jgi:hypothetical protein